MDIHFLTKEYQMFKAVAETRTINNLIKLVEQAGEDDGFIFGIKGERLSSELQAQYLDNAFKGVISDNHITRNYGLRQQMVFLREVEKTRHPKNRNV